MTPMTMRQRMLAFVRGEPHDRVPFIQYDKIAAPNAEVWNLIGRENMGLLRWSNAHRLEYPNCRWLSEPLEVGGHRAERRTLVTPAGEISDVRVFEPTYGAAAYRKRLLETADDVQVFMAYLRDVVVLPDYERVWRDANELGDDGLAHVSVQRTPYQHLWIEWAGLSSLTMLLADYPDLMAECVQSILSVQRRIFDIVRRGIEQGVPIAYVVFPDNITAPVLGRRNFVDYCLPLYRELSGMLGEKTPVFVHMDGNLKPFWDLVDGSGVGGIDSLSPPPDNDTSVAQALARWPQMRVAINFPSSVHVTPPENIYAVTMEILQQGGRSGRLQIQISENVPPGMWRESFPPIMRALRDFYAA